MFGLKYAMSTEGWVRGDLHLSVSVYSPKEDPNELDQRTESSFLSTRIVLGAEILHWWGLERRYSTAQFLGLPSNCPGTIDGVSSVWRACEVDFYPMSGHINGSDDHGI